MLDKMNRPRARNLKPRNFTAGTELMLHSLHAGEYVPVFRKYDLGGKELNDLVDEDLLIMGIVSPALRQSILDHCCEIKRAEPYTVDNALQLLTNTNQQLQRINLAIVANSLSLTNDPDPQDVLVHHNTYATTVMLEVIEKIEEKLQTMSDVLSYNILEETKKLSKRNKRKEKIVIATVGGTVIAVLSYYLVKSLKNL